MFLLYVSNSIKSTQVLYLKFSTSVINSPLATTLQTKTCHKRIGFRPQRLATHH